MRITGLDHIVLRVQDMERSVAWYQEVLGLEPVRLEEWQRGEVPFVSMRLTPTTIIDLQLGEITGVNMDHLALRVHDVDLAALVASGRFGPDVRPPRTLFGAQGSGEGIYVKDPDGHTVELRVY